MLHDLCSTNFPFDPPMQSVTTYVRSCIPARPSFELKILTFDLLVLINPLYSEPCKIKCGLQYNTAIPSILYNKA